MKSGKFLIIGYFGYITNQLDGQTAKTRNVKKLLEEKIGERNVRYFDTQSFQYSWLSYFKLLVVLIMCNNLLYLPGKNNLLKLSFFIDFLIRFKGLKVYYLVVGGWLSEFLAENSKLEPRLRRFRYIGVESKALASTLIDKFGFSNCDFFPNFRVDKHMHFEPVLNDGLKLVFMARIMLEKGLDKLFYLARFIEDNKLDIEITFYGPVAEKDKEFFFSNVRSLSCVEYKGVLEPADIYKVLTGYDVLVLPTRYEGEGFPGSILDAYISGIPVLVTDWKFLPEFVLDGKTGFVIYDDLDLINKVQLILNDKKMLQDMKENSFLHSKAYSSDSAWKKLQLVIFGNSYE